MKIIMWSVRNRKPADEPRLYPAPDTEDCTGVQSNLAEDCDRSYEDALADMQFSRFLHREYDVQAPADSFQRLMLAIEKQQAPVSTPKAPVAAPSRLPRLNAPKLVSLFSSGRLVSGMVAALIVVATVIPNVHLVLNDAPHANTLSSSLRSEGSGAVSAPTHTPVKDVAQTDLYNRTDLLRSDPPDTFAPPRRASFYPSLPDDGSKQDVPPTPSPRKE